MAQSVNEAEEEIDLRSYLSVIGKRRNLIIVGTLLAMLITGILSYFVLPPVYEAQAILLVNQATDKTQVIPQQNQEGAQGVIQQFSPVLTMNTYLGQIKSDELMRKVIDKLKLDPRTYTAESLKNMFTATVQQDSNLIEISVQNKDPQLAATIANTICSEFLAFLSEKNGEQMEQSVAFLQQQRQKAAEEVNKTVKEQAGLRYDPGQQKMLQSQIDRLNAQIDTLDKKITDTQIAQSLEQSRNTVSVVSGATVPLSPVKPNKKLNLAVAFILGLVVFTGLALALEYFDYTVKTPEDVAEKLDLPSLGVIPLVTERSRKASYGK